MEEPQCQREQASPNNTSVGNKHVCSGIWLDSFRELPSRSWLPDTTPSQMLAARFRRSHPFWLLLDGKIPRVLLGLAGCSAGILEADNEGSNMQETRLHSGCMSGCHSRNWSLVTHATGQKDRSVGRQARCSGALPLPDRDSSRNDRMIDAMLKASSKTCRRDAGVVALLQGEDRSVGYGVMTLGSRRHVPIGATRRRGIQIAPFRRLFEKSFVFTNAASCCEISWGLDASAMPEDATGHE